MDLMYSQQWNRYLPVIHPRVPKSFRGNFSLLFPIGDNSSQVLSVGSYEEVQKAIEGFSMHESIDVYVSSYSNRKQKLGVLFLPISR